MRATFLPLFVPLLRCRHFLGLVAVAENRHGQSHGQSHGQGIVKTVKTVIWSLNKVIIFCSECRMKMKKSVIPSVA